MPETVKIGGKPFPKTMVYAAGALTVGILGYAWFTKGRATADATPTPTDTLPEPVPVPTDSTDFGVTGGGPPPTSNAQWYDVAVSKLIALGHDGTAVSAAIGKFLDRKALSVMEQGLVQEAVAAAGNPPQNGPWVIIEQGPAANTPTPLPAPANVSAVGQADHSVYVSWSPVPGATHYAVSYSAPGNVPLGATQTSQTSYRSLPLNPGTYTILVRAENASQTSPFVPATFGI